MPVVTDLAPTAPLGHGGCLCSRPARLNAHRQIWSSTFHPGSSLTLLLCCCYFAAAALTRSTFDLFHFLLLVQNKASRSIFFFFFSRGGLVRGGTTSPRASRRALAEENVTTGFCGTTATNSCGPPGGQRCRCCSHKVTLMSRNREKHMCPVLEAPFHFSTSFACAAANNEPEAVRGWGGGGREGGMGGEATPPAAICRTLIAFHHFLQAHIEGARF